MESQQGGLLSTGLMLLPLVAVPVFAVVGLPDLSNGSAPQPLVGLATDADEFETAASFDEIVPPIPSDAPRFDSPFGSEPTADDSRNDPFQDSDPATSFNEVGLYTPFAPVKLVSNQTEPSAGNNTASTQSPERTAALETPMVEHEAPATPEMAEPVFDSPPRPANRPQPTSRDWQSAVQRINELGIRSYRLTEDAQHGYRFYCIYTRPQEPLVKHRFEATANQPLPAVNQTLDQIDSWLSSQ